jgi:hypothetical protein
VYFDGSGDRLSASSSDFSLDGDFTVEYWIQSQNNTGNSGYVLHFGGGNTSYFGTKSGSYVLQANNNGEHFWTGVPTINTWVHLALVRSGSTVTLYEDGISLGNKTESQTFGNSTFVIADWDGQFPVTGYISNLRIIKGTALYTSNFTPPTGPLEAIDDTVLLTCQGGAITDNGPNSHAITVNNDAEAITASAFEFDGTNDYAVTSSNTDFLFGTEEFAIEWWEYFTSGTGDVGHIGVFQFGSGNNTAHIWSAGGSFTGYPGSWQGIAMSPISNQWAHYVVTGTSGDIRFYQNGELKDTKTWDWSATSSTSNFAVGGTPGWGFGNYAMAGKISSVKVYKGKSFTEDEVKRNFSALRGRYGI